MPPYYWEQWSPFAAAWFKGEPTVEIAKRIWNLVSLLSNYGRYLRILRSTDPGVIRYEDDYQVVVEEFATLKLIKDEDWIVTSIPASVTH